MKPKSYFEAGSGPNSPKRSHTDSTAFKISGNVPGQLLLGVPNNQNTQQHTPAWRGRYRCWPGSANPEKTAVISNVLVRNKSKTHLLQWRL